MKLTIEPTSVFESIEGVTCRRWEGKTEEGIPVHVWVRLLSPQTHDANALALFDKQLQAMPPMERHPISFDLRFVT